MELSTWLIPVVIFLAEVCVVTIGTLRIIVVARGYKFLAPLLGFFEVSLWLLAMTQIMKNLNDWTCFSAFVLGFSLGNYLGILIEKKLAMGMVSVRIVTHRDASDLVEQMREANFGVTCVEGEGATGKVHIIMTVIKRKQLPLITALIEVYHSGAFYAVDDVQLASEGIFPLPRERPAMIPLPLFKVLAEKVMRAMTRQPALASSERD